MSRLHLRAATAEDAPRIAEIHMAAFGENAMLHAQFPTASVRKKLQICIEEKARADINDPKTSVLVIESFNDFEETPGAAVAFAKWSHPVHPSEEYVEPPWNWPEGTDLDTLGAWIAKATEAENRSVGDTPCYHLFFIGTDPSYTGRGAGKLLVQWGIDQSEATGAPLYLESTVEAAHFYENNGFTAKEIVTLPIRVDGGTETQIYEEIVFTYFPKCR
ncbi:putative GNAT family acetyltransferase [Xylariaceae sp. FL0255]|nr:putative GNAT family acetyltransferase [Xylariaceae sp. FL0255]